MTSSPMTLVAFLVFCIFVTNNPSRIHGFNNNLIQIDQVDKTLFPENLTLDERYQRIAEIFRAHFDQIESATSLSLAEWKQPAEYEPYTLSSLIVIQNLGYFVTWLTVGSRFYTPYLAVDAGSSCTWMQCEGCTKCFHIREGNFNRNESLSNRPLPCDDPRCYPKLCKDGWCMYEANYLGSRCFDYYSKGAVGLETFGFQGSGRTFKSFPNTVFGCGLENHKFDWEKIGQNNILAGILGLGLGPQSIFTQYRNETKMRMSYCLPYRGSPIGTHAVLRFGDEAQIRGRVLTTRMLPNIYKCAINVMGISVAGTRLRIPTDFFRRKPHLTGGFILDSGDFHTLLAQTAYNAVRREITQFFRRNYGWHPGPPQPEVFDLCYYLPSGNYTFPRMTCHFGRADLFLEVSNIFHFFDGYFCLIMMAINDGATSVFG